MSQEAQEQVKPGAPSPSGQFALRQTMENILRNMEKLYADWPKESLKQSIDEIKSMLAKLPKAAHRTGSGSTTDRAS